MYQKEIIYMSLFNEDVKEGCVGYLKSEKRQDKYRIEVQIKNLKEVFDGNYTIHIHDAADRATNDLVMIKKGMGSWHGSADGQTLRAEIILSDIYKIKGQSKDVPREKEYEDGADQIITAEAADDTVMQSEAADDAVIQSEAVDDVSIQSAAADDTAIQSEAVKAIEKEASRNRAETIAEESRRQTMTESAEVRSEVNTEKPPIYESKWEQLLSTYEKIHPYGDERIYVKLEPKDFIILPSGYQHLVNNSFLLHGFYNYRYLILGKERDFYLGVPGVFYEREKMVALMFGFEAFECEGGEAKEGKFGYYLRKVEL